MQTKYDASQPENQTWSSGFEINAEVQSPDRKISNKIRVKQLRDKEDLKNNLPEGITYHKQEDSNNDKLVVDSMLVSSEESLREGDIQRFGDFLINLSKVSKESILAMKKLLPQE